MCQVMFWLTFLQSRIPPVEPLGDGGRSHKPAYVMLVATHMDTVKRSGGQMVNMEDLRRKVVDRFGHVFSLEENIITLDTHAAGSQEIKIFKNLLQQRKQQLIEVGLLEWEGAA